MVAALTEATEAAMALYDQPCGVGCVGHHTLLWTDGERGVNVRSIAAPPPSQADELAACYPRRNGHTVDPADWPTPSILNLPLKPTGAPMTPRPASAHGTSPSLIASDRSITLRPCGPERRGTIEATRGPVPTCLRPHGPGNTGL